MFSSLERTSRRADVDIYVYDDVGGLILDDRRPGRLAGVQFRSSYNGTTKVFMHMASSIGLASWYVLVGRRGTIKPETTPPKYQRDGWARRFDGSPARRQSGGSQCCRALRYLPIFSHEIPIDSLDSDCRGDVFFSSCTKTYYVDRTVYVEPTPKPKPVSRATPRPRPRVDNPDSFDAVTKPTTYSY